MSNEKKQEWKKHDWKEIRKRLKYKKVKWSKMHIHDYSGKCVNCGTWCDDKESIKNWAIANENYELAETNMDYKHQQYYAKKISECENFIFN